MDDRVDRPTKYEHMTDEEFVEELRSRLPERSWSLAHLIELERRGRDITKSDPELHEALAEMHERVSKTTQRVAAHLQEQFSASLEPLQKQLRETVNLITPRMDIKALLPNFDHLISPEFARPPKSLTAQLSAPAFSVPELKDAEFDDSAWLPSPPPLSALSDEIIESRQQQIEQANTAVSIAANQLERLTEIRDEARSPRWFDWLMLVFALVAAAGAVGAVVVALV